MKIIFMGSAAFAVPSIQALSSSKHEVVLCITQPDKPAGRGQHVTACPVAEKAGELGIELFQPAKIRDKDAIDKVIELKPDIIIVVAYGKMIPKDIYDFPKYGTVNVHASLLPKLRGAAPVNWAIATGETETGVTTMRIKEELDAGDILLSCKTPIDECEDAVQLYDRLSGLGADLLIETVEGLEKGKIIPEPQNSSKATFAPILKKEDGKINWDLTSKEIYNRVRGFKPWPGSFTHLDGKLLRVHEAAPSEESCGEKPGTIVVCEKHIAVSCGQGTLYLIEVQLEGKRCMCTADFLCGHKLKKGTVLK